MSPPQPPPVDASPEPFAAGRVGRVAIGLIAYVTLAIVATFVDHGDSRVLATFNLYSDSIASVLTAVLAFAAARGCSEAPARRVWLLLGGALASYSVGNLIHSTYWLFGHDPFPSPGEVFFLAFYPLVFAAVLTALRTSATAVPWGRVALDGTILTLGFGAFFWYFVIQPSAAADPGTHLLRYVLSQAYISLNCLMLLAFGVLLMNSGGGPLGRRTLLLLTIGFSAMFLADIVWAMSKVSGEYLPGSVSDAIYLSCYVGLGAAAREHLREVPMPGAPASASPAQGLPYVAMLVSFLVLVYFESDRADNPGTTLTIVIFVLTLLVMLRQGAILRDDAASRERRAAGLVEARYASLIRNSSDVIMITDADGCVRFASPAAERVLERRPSELVGRNLLDLWTDLDRERLAAFLSEAAATRGRAVGPVEFIVGNGTRRYTLESVGSNLLDDPAVGGLALNFRDVSERKALEEQLRQLAFHDPLTLLANRSLFRDRVEHALALAGRSGRQVAVMFLDLDSFKNVNDTLGHDAGDRLLQTAAQRLVKCTRSADTVARLGGDEFAILIEGITGTLEVERLAETIAGALREPLLLDGTECHLAASIGVAFPQPDENGEQLLRNADIAMYQAKSTGKGRFVVFEPHMQEQLRERLRLEEDIERALRCGEFFLEFQPLVDLNTRELLGAEALVRWRHPELGIIPPLRFIPAAEESGQIVRLGQWVLLDACRRIRAWRGAVAGGDSLRVTVNVSGRHLQHGDLAGDVGRALQESGLEPGNLVIELTESSVMHNTDANLEIFRRLKALGVRLAIDDFGMGYSSLSYLHRFPIDILKIDRSFVSRLSDQDDGPELARAVVMLGATLGLETVAEGIEQEDQVEKLLDLGCVAGQGFLFSPACSLEALAEMPFAARRAELRRARRDDWLTATGRFRVDARTRQQSVA
ncbi:MAG: EAL domain-containing protein [Steroidobacteraceae bacterium]|jgi:diguanylate cyclase (GGDEF)-like protein/PAS domain S-box-containing protein|nr:EAL domain-containing protein [Steroidobacteraceae bacterium]